MDHDSIKAAVGTWLVDGVLWIALSLLTLLLPSLSWGATYYVTQAGAGDKSGTTYAKAMGVTEHNAATFAAGDAIYLCGTITSSIVPPSAGESGNPIVYDGACPGYPGVIDGKNAIAFGIGNGTTIGKIYLTIKNLEIKNLIGTNAAAGIWIRSAVAGASAYTGDLYVTVDNCKIHHVYADDTKPAGGIDARGIGLTVTNCEIYNVYYDGIYSDGASFTASGNYIHDVDDNTGTAGGDCIQAGSPAGAWIHHNKLDHSSKATKHCLIISNSSALEGTPAIIEHNEMIQVIAGVGDTASRCLSPEDATNGVIVRYNTFVGGYNAITPLGNVDIYGNTVREAKNSYINYQAATAAGSTLNVYNNSFYGATSFGIYFTANRTHTINIKNNIIHTGNKGIRQSAAGGDNTINIDYNIIYNTTTDYTNVTGGAHDLDVDPRLTSATDFHLLPGSPAINAGTDVEMTSDIEGRAVPLWGLPDIGAYEYAPGQHLMDLRPARTILQ